MNKYKNKDGIELNFGRMTEEGSKGSGTDLVQEVVQEAIKILSMYDRDCKTSMNMAMYNTKKFLKTNFDIGDDNGAG